MTMCKTCGSTPSYCGHFQRREWPETIATNQCAEPQTLDLVYQAMLQSLTLSLQHHRQLRERGFSHDEAQRYGYRTLPLRGRAAVARRLVDQFGQQTCAAIPGLYEAEQNGHRYWTLAGSPGLLLPIRDLQGRIGAFKIRLDSNEIGGKYRTLTSAQYGGPSPGSNVHVPLHDRTDYREVRITEGELKADIATIKTVILTLALPGVAMWHKALPALAILKPTLVLLAFDADWRTNPHVAKALGDCARSISKAGFKAQTEAWDPALGKGIDDLLANGYRPERKSIALALSATFRATAKPTSDFAFKTIHQKES